MIPTGTKRVSQNSGEFFPSVGASGRGEMFI
jgi:hypothetical protein